MSGDHFPNRYFPDNYFPGRYFQGGDQNPGAMSASLSGSCSLAGLLVGVEQVTATDTHDLIRFDPYQRKRRAKQAERKKEVEDLLERLMGILPYEAPKQLVEAVEAVQEKAELLQEPAHQITHAELTALADQVERLDRRLSAHIADMEEEDELMLLWA